MLQYLFLGAISLMDAFFGRGDGPIYFSNVQCAGNENRLIECSNSGLNMIGQCEHDMDAGLLCSEGTSQLGSGLLRTVGLLANLRLKSSV